MELEYTVGTKIRISPNLGKESVGSSRIYLTSPMLEYAGCYATIVEKILHKGESCYRLDIDKRAWTWAPYMFFFIDRSQTLTKRNKNRSIKF